MEDVLGQGYRFKEVKLMEVINVMAGPEQEYTEVYHRINKFLCAYSTLQFRLTKPGCQDFMDVNNY